MRFSILALKGAVAASAVDEVWQVQRKLYYVRRCLRLRRLVNWKLMIPQAPHWSLDRRRILLQFRAVLVLPPPQQDPHSECFRLSCCWRWTLHVYEQHIGFAKRRPYPHLSPRSRWMRQRFCGQQHGLPLPCQALELPS